MKQPRPYRKVRTERAQWLAQHLRHLRFRRMLEAVRDLVNLQRDGIEKLGGDFVLDRHYIETLVDRALTESHRISYDAAVLDPAHGSEVLRGFHSRRLQAGSILAAPPADGAAARCDTNGSPEVEPEYRLLAGITRWIGGPTQGGPSCLWGMVRDAVTQAARSHPPPEKLPGSAITYRSSSPAAHNIVHLIETDSALRTEQAPPTEPATARRLLRLLFDTSQSSSSQQEPHQPTRSSTQTDRRLPPDRHWLAVSTGSHLSIETAGANPSAQPVAIRLDVILGDEPDEDLLFVILPESAAPRAAFPRPMFMEEVSRGLAGWCFDFSDTPFESFVRQVGRCVLETPIDST